MKETKSGFMIATAAAAIALSACGAAADGSNADPQIVELVQSLNSSCGDLEDKANHDACVSLYRETAANASETLTQGLLFESDRHAPVDVRQMTGRLNSSCVRSFRGIVAQEEIVMPDHQTSQAMALCSAGLKFVFEMTSDYLPENKKALVEGQVTILQQLPDCFAPTSFDDVQAHSQAIANGEEPPELTCDIEVPVTAATMEAEPG